MARDLAGNSLTQARRVTVAARPKTFRDAVDQSDRNDYYTFTLRSASNLNGLLSGIRAGARVNLEVLNSGGQRVLNSRPRGRKNKGLDGFLDAGTYFVRVFRRSGSSRYNFKLSAAPPADLAGNSLADARAISLTPTPFSDFVSDSGDANDYYRITLTEKLTKLDASITGLKGGVQVQVLNSNDQSLGSIPTDGSAGTVYLNAGTYYVRVNSIIGSSTSYNLALTGTPIPDNPGETTAAAQPITLSGTAQIFNDFVTDSNNADPDDYYTFTLNNKSTKLSASITGLTAGVQVTVRDINNGLITSFPTDGSTGETILAAGTYYVRVNPIINSTTNYQLSLTGTAIADNAGDTTATAQNITLSSTPISFNDFVGSSDSRDYYKFTLPSRATINTTVLTSPGRVGTGQGIQAIIVDVNDGIVASLSTPNASTTLNSGTYYLRLNPIINADPIYTLTVAIP